MQLNQKQGIDGCWVLKISELLSGLRYLGSLMCSIDGHDSKMFEVDGTANVCVVWSYVNTHGLSRMRPILADLAWVVLLVEDVSMSTEE